MNTETDYLQSIAEKIVADKNDDNQNTNNANHHLLAEAKRLEKAIIYKLTTIENFTQRDTFLFNTLSKLVNISDRLYDTTNSVNPNVLVLRNLITAIRQVIPTEVRPNLKLSKGFIAEQMEHFTETWALHNQLMKDHNIPEKLITIAGISFKRFIEPKVNLYWGDFTWLNCYKSKLDIMDWENADCNSPEEALLSLLIGRDFNDDRFFIYCKRYIKNRTNKLQGKQQRLLEYAKCEKLIQEDTQTDTASYDAETNSVSTRLSKWIREEIDFVETHERHRPTAKFEFKWNVEMIAFFFKLLHERQAFGKVTLERFAGTIAANCSSVGKEEFQPATIHSRFYMKDLQVIKATEALLADMLEAVRKYLR